MTAERTRYFKHIFAGSERIATKPCGEPCRTKGGGIPLVPVEAPPVKDSLVMNTQSLPSPPPVSIRDSLWSTYFNQTANCLGVQRQNLLLDFRINSLEAHTSPLNENTTYFYHSDHLGSTGYLSTHLQNGHARITQHYQYTPFGEAFVHQKYWQNTAQFNHQNPYEFNGKEKDIETGYNYYGARHYNSSWGIWLSVDPLADHPNQVDKSPYAAMWNNPIKYNDPDGRCPECRENIKNPTDGQSYKSTGGAEYIFGNGDWTRQGGTLHEVVVTASGNSENSQLDQSWGSSWSGTLLTVGGIIASIGGAKAFGAERVFGGVLNNFKALQAESNTYQLGLHYGEEGAKAANVLKWSQRIGTGFTWLGAGLAVTQFAVSDQKSAGDYTRLGMNALIFGLTVTPEPITTGIGIGLGLLEAGGAFNCLYDYADQVQHTGIMLVHMPGGGVGVFRIR